LGSRHGIIEISTEFFTLNRRPIVSDIDFIIAFENGELEIDDLVAGFQRLIDNDAVWRLQGMYGRCASRLIEMGFCHPKVVG